MIYHFFQYFCGIIYYQTAMQRIIFLFLSAVLIISCGKKEVPAHAIHLIGIIQVDTAFNTRLQALYEKAKASGILDNTYRITNSEEYFAEAVQDWFNVNAEMPHADGKHNWCNTREELKEYDPDLYQLLSEYFPQTNLQISKHPKVNMIGKY